MARTPLIDRLPAIWRRLDKDAVLEKFLSVVDSSFDLAHDTTKQLFSLRTVDDIPDRYVRMLADLVGHQWRTDRTYAWNRNRIRDSIHRHSYKGTTTRLSDDIIAAGADSIVVDDNAKYLLTWSTQGAWSETDSVLETANFWHDGAFVLVVVNRSSQRANRPEVEAAMSLTVPAGTIWYVAYGKQLPFIFDLYVTLGHGQMLHSGNTRDLMLGFGKFSDSDVIDGELSWSWQYERGVHKGYYPIVWHTDGTTRETCLGHGLWGHFDLSWDSDADPFKYYYPVVWHIDGTTLHDFWSFGAWNEIGLSWDDGYTTNSYIIKTRHDYTQILFDLVVSRTFAEYFTRGVCFDLTSSAFNTQYLRFAHEETDPLIAQQGSIWTQWFSLAGTYLTGESNLPANIDVLTVTEGTVDNPLTEYHASLQAAPSKFSYADGGEVTETPDDLHDYGTISEPTNGNMAFSSPLP